MKTVHAKVAFLVALVLTLSLFLAPSVSFAANDSKANGQKEQHCVLSLGAANKATNTASPVLDYQCYDTQRELDAAKQPMFKFSKGSALKPQGTTSGVNLITLFTDEYTGGSSYAIDGYAGCSAYYYVNSLSWMNNDAESAYIPSCKPSQHLFAQQNLQGYGPPTNGGIWSINNYNGSTLWTLHGTVGVGSDTPNNAESWDTN